MTQMENVSDEKVSNCWQSSFHCCIYNKLSYKISLIPVLIDKLLLQPITQSVQRKELLMYVGTSMFSSTWKKLSLRLKPATVVSSNLMDVQTPQKRGTRLLHSLLDRWRA
jgi:hypothetical protein